jgi:hypothetical protein
MNYYKYNKSIELSDDSLQFQARQKQISAKKKQKKSMVFFIQQYINSAID